MQIVTLTTDLGNADHYVPLIKGHLLQTSASLNLVDITHQIQAFDAFKAGEILGQCLPAYPAGTLHLVSVTPLNPKTLPVIMARVKEQYVIASDNGMWGFLLKDGMEPEWMVEIKPEENTFPESFALIPYFRKGLQHLLEGKPRQAGKEINTYEEKIPFLPYLSGDSLSGYVIHVDYFGNVITNLSLDIFMNAASGRKFSIQYGSRNNIDQIHRHYEEVDLGMQVALFNSNGLLELAVNHGNASKLLGLKRHDKIVVVFE
jgi:S-adenosylmethionine hydrolase